MILDSNGIVFLESIPASSGRERCVYKGSIMNERDNRGCEGGFAKKTC